MTRQSKSNAKSRNTSNPFSTGGGGEDFQTLVTLYYQFSLLNQTPARGLKAGITSRVSLQQSHAGAAVDDIVVSAFDHNTQQTTRLAIQAKHDIAFGDNEIFNRVISDCWKMFTNSDPQWQFNSEWDRLFIIK